MTALEQLEMNSSFGEWYRRAKIEPRNEELIARSKAIEAFTKKVDQDKIAELVRCFVGLPPRLEKPMEAFTRDLLSADAAFPTVDNHVEMQVLSGATLATILEQSSSNGDFAALLLVSAVAQGFRKTPIVPDIVSIAHSYLSERTSAVRKLGTRVKFPIFNVEEFAEAVTESAATNSAAQMQKPLDSALRKLAEAINNLAATTERTAQYLERADGVSLEESNIVWWVFGEHSRDLSVRFSELPSGFAAIIAGKELAELVRILPGPKAAPAYLDKQLNAHRNQKLKLSDLMAEVRPDWLREQKPVKDLLDLTPINFIMSNISEGLDVSAAIQLAKRQLNVGSTSVDILAISMQVYTEFLTMKMASRS